MKVLLVKPYNLSDHIQPSLGLGMLASAIRHKHEVEILDCIKEGVKISRFRERVERFAPQVVGFQTYTFDLDFVKEALRICKEMDAQAVTMVGGPHPSGAPIETMEFFYRDLDFAFGGEAEIGLPLLLERIERGTEPKEIKDIPGLIWRQGKRVIVNDKIYVQDLDKLGMPAWDLIHPETYPESQHGAFYRKFPIAPLMLTRGCPFSCTFCMAHLVSGKKLRKRSAEHVLEEMKILYNEHGIREFHIIDDNFTMNKEYAKSFLCKLIDSGLDISWAVPNGIRADTLDEEMLDLMKQSGLYLISIGIESGSDRILELMKKSVTTEEIRKRVKLIRRAGLEAAGFFILGFPSETKEEMEATIRFSLDMDLLRANFFTYLPFPGTESYQQLLDNDEIRKVDWDRFYFMNAAYVPGGMTRKQLKNLQRKAFFRFFLRPKILYKNLKSVKSLRHLGFLIKRFYHWIIMS